MRPSQPSPGCVYNLEFYPATCGRRARAASSGVLHYFLPFPNPVRHCPPEMPEVSFRQSGAPPSPSPISLRKMRTKGNAKEEYTKKRKGKFILGRPWSALLSFIPAHLPFQGSQLYSSMSSSSSKDIKLTILPTFVSHRNTPLLWHHVCAAMQCSAIFQSPDDWSCRRYMRPTTAHRTYTHEWTSRRAPEGPSPLQRRWRSRGGRGLDRMCCFFHCFVRSLFLLSLAVMGRRSRWDTPSPSGGRKWVYL